MKRCEVARFYASIVSLMIKIFSIFSCCYPQICHFVLCRTRTLPCKDSNAHLLSLHDHLCSHVTHRHCDRHFDLKLFRHWAWLPLGSGSFARPCRWYDYLRGCLWSFGTWEVEKCLGFGSVALCHFGILHSHGSWAFRWIIIVINITWLDNNYFFYSWSWSWRTWAWKSWRKNVQFYLKWPLTMQKFQDKLRNMLNKSFIISETHKILEDHVNLAEQSTHRWQSFKSFNKRRQCAKWADCTWPRILAKVHQCRRPNHWNSTKFAGARTWEKLQL